MVEGQTSWQLSITSWLKWVIRGFNVNIEAPLFIELMIMRRVDVNHGLAQRLKAYQVG